MPKNGRKRPQLRRCTHCDKPGHNKKTCPIFLSQNNQTKKSAAATGIPTVKTPRSPVHFFIHHTAGAPVPSPHLIDLKDGQPDIWREVRAAAPAERAGAIHDFYRPAEQTRPRPRTPENTTENATQTSPAIGLHEQTKRVIPRRDRFKDWSAGKARTAADFWQNGPVRLAGAVKTKLSLPRLSKVTAIVALIAILPAQANSYYSDVKKTADLIATDSAIGLASLQDATGAMLNADLPAAQDSLNTAVEKFSSAADTLESRHEWLLKIAAGIPFLKEQITSKQNILLAGQKIALGNIYLLKGISAGKEANAESLLDRFNTITIHLRAALPHYNRALELLADVDGDALPPAYQTPFQDFYKLFSAVVEDMRNLAGLGDNINEIFGGRGLRRYLLVFQNQNELRPTGGFIGSFAVLDIKDGKIVNLDVPAGGSYDLQGQLTVDIAPPAPLLLSNNRWEFQDANWFPDFPASAEKLLWFYRKSRNVTADGVISINATVLERLLGIIGPVTDEKRGIILTNGNALSTIQQIVETGPEKISNKPKQIISDLAPKFIAYLRDTKPDNILPLLTNLKEALNRKEIQGYFTDRTTETAIQSFGWGGAIIPTQDNQDYLLIVNTNIQGQKSDARVRQSISHQAVVQADGSIIDNVVITREHGGDSREALYGQTNINYIRLYVPEGSELISAGGFTWPDENKFKAVKTAAPPDEFLTNLEKEIKYDETSGTRITREFGKSAFGNWIITEPGQTSQVQFVYKLPFKAFTENKNAPHKLAAIFTNNKKISRYQLIAQKQSGLESKFESQIIYPSGWRPEWKDGTNITLAANGAAIYNQTLNTDSVWSMAMIK